LIRPRGRAEGWSTCKLRREEIAGIPPKAKLDEALAQAAGGLKAIHTPRRRQGDCRFASAKGSNEKR